MRVPEPLQLDQGVSPVVLDNPRELALDLNPEGVEHVPEVHPGEPAPDVELLGEHHPDGETIPVRRGDEAGQTRPEPDGICGKGQGLASRPVQARRDCQEASARLAEAPWRGMGMPPEMTAGTHREPVTARPRRVRRRTPLWAVTPPPE
jgi:hypothetical protein